VSGQADTIRARIADGAAVTRGLLEPEHVACIGRIADTLAGALARGGTVLLCGNGGSAADASHLAAELVGRLRFDRPALPALALADSAAAVTCTANDDAYAEVFARQVQAHGRPGDVLVALSTSGASANVVRALAVARERRLATVGLTGAGGGAVARLADVCLRVPSARTERIQEAHLLAGHIACELVEERLFSAWRAARSSDRRSRTRRSRPPAPGAAHRPSR
jgi:D-sedoheptulose 7-phosphate isomerase